MRREVLINQIEDQGCYLDEDNDPGDPAGQWYVNCISFDTCLVPFEEELSVPTLCHIWFELKAAPPFEFESDFEIYKLWRTHEIEEKAKKPS